MECDFIVLGGGVIGLSIAAQLPRGRAVLIESGARFGQEASSRNSEVVHSGIYYPAQSFKTSLCIQGREQLYAFAQKYRVPFQKVGKLVVAFEANEGSILESLYSHAQSVRVPVQRFSSDQVKGVMAAVSASAALFFPETGIVDSHAFLSALEGQCLERGVALGYRHQMVGVERVGSRWQVQVKTPEGPETLSSHWVVNAMGLGGAKWSNVARGSHRWEHRACQGRYFNLAQKYRRRVPHLVYPVPEAHGLGVHLTLDLEGNLRLGPDVAWLPEGFALESENRYDVDWGLIEDGFLKAGRRFFPGLEKEALHPGTVGIRPKLFVDGKAHTDFLIESQNGWVHCLGIESPGLTASLAIGSTVGSLVG
jgi:L-2-hydroxyglutarate oxidase LhgO